VLNSGVNLLIADNDPSIRYSLLETFRRMGHNVRTAADSSMALDAIAATVPDVLVADLDMPRMSGFELLNIVRRRFPSVYVIAMKGSKLRGATPGGIGADGLYEESSGIVDLLKVVSDGVSSARQSVWAYRKSTPVIMQRGESCRFTTTAIFIGLPGMPKSFSSAIRRRRSP
jgi:CheY-like chemotaxis protein